jgi:hypothetical protein
MRVPIFTLVFLMLKGDFYFLNCMIIEAHNKFYTYRRNVKEAEMDPRTHTQTIIQWDGGDLMSLLS